MNVVRRLALITGTLALTACFQNTVVESSSPSSFVNSAPSISESCFLVATQSAAYTCAPMGSDVDGDTLTWGFTGGHSCAWASIDPWTGVVSGTPNDDQVGACTLEFTAWDTSSAYATNVTLNLTVGNVVPSLSIANQSINEDSGTLSLLSSDVAADEEGFGVYTIVTPTGTACSDNGVVGAINSSTGEISFTPSTNYFGTCEIRVRFDDGNVGGIVESQFTVTVSGVNDAPTANNITPPALIEDTQSIITLSYADIDGVAVSCLVSTPTNVTETLPCACVAGSCTVGVTGTTAYTGTASFSYTVTDGAGAVSNSATANLTINHGSATQLVYSTVPTSVVAGASFPVVVEVQDANGHVITSGPDASTSISLTLNTGTINGVSPISAVSGVATFAARSINVTGAYTLTASNGSLTNAVSAITVNPGALSLTNSMVTVSSSSVTVGDTSTLTLTKRDAYGNLIPIGGDAVTFSQSAGTSSGTIGSVTDNADGTYSANFTGVIAGSPVQIGATINASSIISTLPNIQVYLDVMPLYSGNSDWNRYVRNDGPDRYHASNVSCVGSETGTYLSGCIHGGEKFKVTVNGTVTCANLTLSDSQGVLNWVCDASSGTATFYSSGLKAGKGLRDLIQNSSSFRSLSVDLKLSGSTIATSLANIWWGNTVVPLPNNAGGAVTSLPTAGQIYVLESNQSTMGYNITADRIALVTLAGAELLYEDMSGSQATNCNTSTGLTTTPTNASIICGGNRNFLWVEANLRGNGGTWLAHSAITSFNWNYSRIHNTTVAKLHPTVIHHAIFLNNSTSSPGSNLVTNIGIFHASGGLEVRNTSQNIFKNINIAYLNGGTNLTTGIYLNTGATKNSFHNIQISHHIGSHLNAAGVTVSASENDFSGVNISNMIKFGMNIGGGGADTIVNNMTISANQDVALQINGSDNTMLNHVTIANSSNSAAGIHLPGGSANNNVLNSIAIANVNNGIQTIGTSTGTGNIFNNIAVSNYTNKATDFTSATGFYAQFNGFFIAGTTPSCVGAAPGTTLNTSCERPGPIPAIAINISSGFVGKVGAELINSSGAGLNTYANLTSAAATILDWLDFENVFRSWGRENAVAFPDTTHRGQCTSGTCRIWDWRAVLSGPLQNRSFSGNSDNAAFISANPCPAGVDGSQVLTAPAATPRTYLMHADEVNEDDIGNNNGLCESNEACIYAPNIGAYQGEGDYKSAGSCIFNDGAVSGVEMFAYPVTGI